MKRVEESMDVKRGCGESRYVKTAETVENRDVERVEKWRVEMWRE